MSAGRCPPATTPSSGTERCWRRSSASPGRPGHVLVDGSITYLLGDVSTLWRAAVVVEERDAELFRLERVKEGFLPDLLARVQVRYPSIPIMFCDTRPLAEQWVYRFLGAALSEAKAEASGRH